MMNCKVILAICLTLAGTSALETKDSVQLTLFYESYCPYSIDFIVQQLYGAWDYFKPYLILNLVPFGNAEQSFSHGHFHFTCQHGPKECVGNILHACTIYERCGNNGTQPCPVDKLSSVMNYLNCVMQQPDQKKASNKCAKSFGINPKVVNKCAHSKVGEWLESAYGNQTKAFKNPPVTYVPFIAINGKHNETMQDDAQTDLKGLLCKYIPKACK